GHSFVGSVANSEGAGRQCVSSGDLRGDAEDRADELALRDDVASGNPTDLTFANRVHRLVTFNRSTSTLHRSESETCGDSLLDEPMVLLDDVVQIRRRSATTASSEFTSLLQLGDCASVGSMPIHVDQSRPRSTTR